jgi:protein-tyrosine phosphatase
VLEGFDVVVSLLTPEETAEFELTQEHSLAQTAGLEFAQLSIPDRGVPPSRGDAEELLAHLSDRLAAGKTVALHCRQGIGRSGLIAAGLLAMSGVAPAAAFDQVSNARGRPVPETAEQKRWVEDLDPQRLARSASIAPSTTHHRVRRRR